MDDQGQAQTKAIRAHFKSRGGIQPGELQLRETLGQGHFGRVRLVEAASVTENPVLTEFGHTGLFALKIMKKSEVIRLKEVQHVQDERKLLLKTLTHPFIVTA